jgi:hypothetical protein
MATVAKPLATCSLRWIYEQAAAILQLLKNFLLGIIAFIDAQIAILRAWIAQLDPVVRATEFIWSQIQKVLDAIREAMTAIPQGPLAELCPEFYSYFLDPAWYLYNTTVAALTRFKERFLSMYSFLGQLDRLLGYWEQSKANLIMAIDVIDDALYKAYMDSADAVP